tara:strand:+ start:188 stop:763 length:576 start_codon:yes stop_codon:yes gene_type:complete
MSENLYSLITDISQESVAKLPEDAQMFLKDYSASIAKGVTAISTACDEYGYNLLRIQQLRAKHKEFSAVLTKLRKYADSVELAKLEQVSTANAENPKSVTERIFRLKSLDASRYSDKKQVNHSGEININFGLGVVGYASTDAPPPKKEIKSEIKVSTAKQSKQSKHSTAKHRKFTKSIASTISNINARADK